MKAMHSILAVALSLGFASAAVAETVVIAEPQVRTIVTKAGYAEPVLIKRDQDLWRVQSVNPAGEKVTIFVNARGEVLGAADVARTRVVETTTTTTTTQVPADPVDEGEVASILIDAGFHNVHDVDRLAGVWKAEADDITGEDFEVHIDAKTGMIVHIEDD